MANNNRRYAILAITKHHRLLSTSFAGGDLLLTSTKLSAFFSDLRQEIIDKYKIALKNIDLPLSNQCNTLELFKAKATFQ